MRTQFTNIITNENDINFRDIFKYDWSDFTFNENTFTYRITENDINRPDIMALQFYGNQDFLDVLLLVNNIDDPFAMTPNSKIFVPPVQDIRNFLSKSPR